MKQVKLVGAGVISAIASSLCCIIPVLALVAGTTGMASAFSWVQPARPYLMGFTVLVLAYAWYRKLRPLKINTDDCGCEAKEISFLQSKKFLTIITVFAVVMLFFPSYSPIFYPQNKNSIVNVAKENTNTVEFKISGMTCESCEEHVKHAVNKLPGIINTTVSYSNTNAIIQFDHSKTSIEQIVTAINSTGYKTTEPNRQRR